LRHDINLNLDQTIFYQGFVERVVVDVPPTIQSGYTANLKLFFLSQDFFTLVITALR